MQLRRAEIGCNDVMMVFWGAMHESTKFAFWSRAHSTAIGWFGSSFVNGTPCT